MMFLQQPLDRRCVSENPFRPCRVFVWLRRAVGATVVNRTEELKEEDVGTECGLFEIEKIGDE